MRLLVISDVHGATAHLRRVIDSQPTANAVVFLGDGLREVAYAAEQYPHLPFFTVPGNYDFGAAGPFTRMERWGGRDFLFTHGHNQNVKYGLYNLELTARQAKVEVALFGHTHQPLVDYHDGLYLVNPGSLRDGRYAYIDITPGGILPVLLTL